MKNATFILLIIVLFFFFAIEISDVFLSKNVENKTVKIEKGASIREIATLLEKNEIISSSIIFVALSKILNWENQLQYGFFNFSGKYSIFKIKKQLSNGEVVKYPITIPEGFTIYKIANKLSEKDSINFSKFVEFCNDTTFIHSLNIPANTLEGFLFPDTYYIPYFADEKCIIKMMVANFFQKMEGIQRDEIPFDSLYSVLILASIVEREAILDGERALIAGVYRNRLTSNMLLQADPTVAYALELKGQSRRKIFYEDLKINSVFNTYIHSGLPPTPICNPGIKSIMAAFNPQETDYYYFFAGDNYKHIFSKTYREHLNKLYINRL